MTLLIASLFFTTPAPLEMPRAEAYLVKEGEVRRLEDRYSVFDLWASRRVVGRWFDDAHTFVLSRLDVLPPALQDELPRTRADYAAMESPADPKDPKHLARMVDLLSPVEPAKEFESARRLPHGYRSVVYCQGTNTSAIVCAFRPEKSRCWLLAAWELGAEDDFDECLERFEEEFLRKGAWKDVIDVDTLAAKPQKANRRREGEKRERELLRDDMRHNVAAYSSWHFSGSDDIAVLDDLSSRGFAVSLTNDLPRWRADYAATLPTPIDGSNVLAAARIYSNRADYLDAAGEDMAWSAAYWMPLRREIVAYLPPDGTETLRKTLRHEAFHQYLSYALAMIPVSPWLNEGYAEYFENGDTETWAVTPEQVDQLSEQLPALVMMDYAHFYQGSDEGRRLKYRLAWSIAFFLEKGAPLVRFQPFKDVKRNYVDSLLKTHDMRQATEAAFPPELLLQFMTEWRRFWKNQ